MLARTLVLTGVCTLAWEVLSGPILAAEPADSQRYAFLVGVNDYSTYEDDNLRNLSFCVADMKSLQEKLETIGFKRVYCLTTESTTAWQPSKAQIEKRLGALLADEDIGPNDFVLLALSGHGLELKGVGGDSTAYFCPADGHGERIETLLPVMWFYRQLAQSKAGMKMLLVDACRNLAESRAGDVKPELSTEAKDFMKSLADSAPPKGIAALLSCQSGQFSHEVPELGHGVFMHEILEGLSGKADLAAGNRDGWVSLSELFNYAADQTEEYVDTRCPVRYSAQTPILRGDLPNYKLVRLENVPRPEMPSEIKLTFTVVERSDRVDKPIEGAIVEVLYRRADGAAEATLGTLTSGSDGQCSLKLPFYWSEVQGDFLAAVSRDSQTERFALNLRTEERSWFLPLPKLEPIVSVPHTTPMPTEPRPSSPSEITNSIGMKLKLIPAGEFLMGSGESAESLARAFENYGKPQAILFSDEYPQHRVRITKPFYLGAHEVTLGQFLEFYHDAGYKTEAERDGKGGYGYTGNDKDPFAQEPRFVAWETGFPQTNDHPVVNVSWNDAVAFCQWLSLKEGQIYRLPTEAEWEYACRAGTTTRYWYGDDPEGLARIGNVADGTAKENFSGRTAIAARGGYVFTAPVGQFPSNPFGLYDMHGNVWEWCADWYDFSYYGVSALEDPKGPDSGAYRVSRGGGWFSSAGGCRSANRDDGTPDGGDCDLGFRVARVSGE